MGLPACMLYTCDTVATACMLHAPVWPVSLPACPPPAPQSEHDAQRQRSASARPPAEVCMARTCEIAGALGAHIFCLQLANSVNVRTSQTSSQCVYIVLYWTACACTSVQPAAGRDAIACMYVCLCMCMQSDACPHLLEVVLLADHRLLPCTAHHHCAHVGYTRRVAHGVKPACGGGGGGGGADMQ